MEISGGGLNRALGMVLGDAQPLEQGVLCLRHGIGHFQGHRYKSNRMTGGELAQFPELGTDHCGRAHKTTQAWTIGSQNHRHVTGEIDRSNGVGVVMDVARVQTRFSAVASCPSWFGANQSNPSAARVVVHLPACCPEHLHVLWGKEVRRTVRALQDSNVPV